MPQQEALQRRAAEWYEQRAASDPANATRWLCEAVHHRFALDGPAAEPRWRRRLADARAEWRPDRRRALAAEALADRSLISPRALQRARWELAFAAVPLAHP